MNAPVAAGDILAGKYRVDRVLGEGGMGVVVAATDQQLERKVAIKFLLPSYAQHSEASQRFLREARAAVKIQSDHVARVIDVNTMENGSPYMVMEYLEGGDLAKLIEEHRQVPLEESVTYVLEACDAIAEAHSVGIVHRDLKPANLFLARQPDGSQRIKVLDFGISKALVSPTGSDPSLTRTSSMMGSPLYMSPEQMKSAKNVDPRTDVWALGVILYELLTGEPPFIAESIPELSAKVLLDQPTPIRSKRTDVPEAIEAIVARALAKDPAARFPTIADLASALAPFGSPRSRTNVERAARVLKISGTYDGATSQPQKDGQAAYARTAATWTDTKGGNRPKSNRGAIIGGFVALAVVAGGAGLLLSGKGTPPAPSAEVGAAAPPHADTAPPAPAKPPTPEAPAVAPATAVVTAEPVVSPSATPAEPAASAASAAAPAKPGAKPLAVRPKPGKPAKPEAPSQPAPAPVVDPLSSFGSRK